MDSSVESRLPGPTQQLQTNIFLDATLSMKGFVSQDGLSNYQQVIPVLETAAAGSVTFWKFGNAPSRLEGRQHREADKASFYPNSKDFAKTQIEEIFKWTDDKGVPAVSSDNLTLIVTDLFQEKADIEQLTPIIREHYFANNKAVGIFAIRSQYKGTIYDVGINSHQFDYSSNEEPRTFRPFYILAFGTHNDISNYFDRLDELTRSFDTSSSAGSDFKTKHRLVISKYLVEEPVSLLDATIKVNSAFAQSSSGIVVNTSAAKNPFKEFNVKKGVSGDVFSAEIPVAPLPYTPVWSTDLESEITVSGCGSETTGSNGENPVSVTASQAGQNKIALTTKADSNRFGGDGARGFKVTLRPKRLELPNWVSEMNMTGDQIERWFQNSAQFDGSRTYNLEPFLYSLLSEIERGSRPKLAEFYIFLKRS
jgi:hypothetical protein